MRKIPDDFERRPKPDMCIMTKKRGRRSKFVIWDWKSPTEGHQKEAEEEGEEHYRKTAETLKEEGWRKTQIVIQSVVPGICTKGL